VNPLVAAEHAREAKVRRGGLGVEVKQTAQWSMKKKRDKNAPKNSAVCPSAKETGKERERRWEEGVGGEKR